MKNYIQKTILVAGLCALATLVHADPLATTLRAFESKPGYVQPLATSLGSINNQGWVRSAKVGSKTGWNLSLLVPITYIGTADHTYDFSYDDNCASLNALGKNCPTNGTSTLKGVPTIWGPNSNAVYYGYRSSGDEPTDIMSIQLGTVDDGHEDIRKLVTLGLPFLQLGITKHHVAWTVRGMWLPAISEFGGYNNIGMGLQYDFTRFLPKQIKEKDLFTSVATNGTLWSLSYLASGDVNGELTLDGMNTQVSCIVGWRYGAMELFTELGYETSSLKAGGALVDSNPGEGEDPNIRPNVQVDGRNGLKASLNVAFHIGSWLPVLSQSFGAQIGTTANILQFGKEGQ